MSSIKGRCRLHKYASYSFCTQHAVMCCPTCHQSANPDCAVITTADAQTYYERLIQSSRISLDDVREQCMSTRNSLEDLQDDMRRQSAADKNAVNVLCDLLRTVVDNFQHECMQKIEDQTPCLGNVTKRIREMDELDIFLGSLNGTSPESDDVTDSGISCRPNETHRQIVNNLIELNAKSMQLKDAVSSAKGILSEDYDVDVTQSAISTNCQSSTDIVDRLKTELSALSKRFVTTPEGASVPCLSGAAGVPQIDAEANSTLTYAVPKVRSFNMISSCNYTGIDPVVCYVQSSPGHVLQSTRYPCLLGIIGPNREQILVVKTDTSILGMCVRDGEIFAVGNDKTLRVYGLDSLTLLQRVSMQVKASSIDCLGPDLVISCPWNDDRSVYIMSDYGCLINRSACKFEYPNFLVVTPSEDRILVSDAGADAVFILTPDLDIMRVIDMKEPRGLCVVGQSFYVASVNSNAVLEFSLEGEKQRTALAQNDGINSPFDISYHNRSGRLVVSCRTDDTQIFVFSSTP